MLTGWIKIHRKLIDWQWYQDCNTKSLFLHLLLKANHKDAFWLGHEIKRGQLITSISHISKETGISAQSIRTSIERLKSTCEITSESTSSFTRITICNYDSYQGQEFDDNEQINKPSNKQLTTNKNNKNEDNENNNKEIPLPFSSDAFKDTWKKWVIHRHEIKKRLTYTQIQNQLAEMKGWGEAESIARMNNSITNGWQGLFEVKATAKGSTMANARTKEEIHVKSLI